MSRIAFATTTIGRDPTRAVMLFDSLRTFGGELADSPCIMLVPEKREPLPDKAQERLGVLDVHQVPFDIDEEAARFPLALLAYAAALRVFSISSALLMARSGSSNVALSTTAGCTHHVISPVN